MRMLRKLHRKIQELPQDKADAIADRIGAESTLEFNRRMQGLTKSMDRSGIDAPGSSTRRSKWSKGGVTLVSKPL